MTCCHGLDGNSGLPANVKANSSRKVLVIFRKNLRPGASKSFHSQGSGDRHAGHFPTQGATNGG